MPIFDGDARTDGALSTNEVSFGASRQLPFCPIQEGVINRIVVRNVIGILRYVVCQNDPAATRMTSVNCKESRPGKATGGAQAAQAQSHKHRGSQTAPSLDVATALLRFLCLKGSGRPVNRVAETRSGMRKFRSLSVRSKHGAK